MWSVYEFIGGYSGFPIFKNKNIETLIIPKTITEFINTSDDYVKGDTVSDLDCLKQYIVDENNPKYSSEDGVLFNKEKTDLLSYPCKKEDSEYVIPEEVTRIRTGAFFRIGSRYNNGALKKLTITKNVQEINWPSGGETTINIENIVIDNIILGEENLAGIVYDDDSPVTEGRSVSKFFGSKEIVVYKDSPAHKYYKSRFTGKDLSNYPKLTVVANPYVKEEPKKETASRKVTSDKKKVKDTSSKVESAVSERTEPQESAVSETAESEDVTTIVTTESETTTENKAETKPKKSSKVWVVVSVAAVVILAGGVTAAYFAIKKKNKV